MTCPEHEFLLTVEAFSQYLKQQQNLGNQQISFKETSRKIIEKWGTAAWYSHGFTAKGPVDARLVFVDSDGSFFDGPEGQLFVKILKAMHLTASQIYICNTANLDRIKTHTQTHSPRVLVTLGEKAGQMLLNTQDRLFGFRGRFFEFNGIQVMPTHHPKALLETPSLKRQTWDDMQQVMTRAGL